MGWLQSTPSREVNNNLYKLLVARCCQHIAQNNPGHVHTWCMVMGQQQASATAFSPPPPANVSNGPHARCETMKPAPPGCIRWRTTGTAARLLCSDSCRCMMRITSCASSCGRAAHKQTGISVSLPGRRVNTGLGNRGMLSFSCNCHHHGKTGRSPMHQHTAERSASALLCHWSCKQHVHASVSWCA